jgi:hypothetical protein
MIRLAGAGAVDTYVATFSHGVPSGGGWTGYTINHNQGKKATRAVLFNTNVDQPVPDTLTGYNPSTGHWMRWYLYSSTNNSIGVLAGRISESSSSYKLKLFFDDDMGV